LQKSGKGIDRRLAGDIATDMSTHAVRHQSQAQFPVDAEIILVVGPEQSDIGCAGELSKLGKSGRHHGNHPDRKQIVGAGRTKELMSPFVQGLKINLGLCGTP
jgi:hypothetical protein